MVVGITSVAGAKTAEMFFSTAELSRNWVRFGTVYNSITGQMRSKTEVNYQKLLGDCAFIRQSKVESATISTPSQQHYARKISN